MRAGLILGAALAGPALVLAMLSAFWTPHDPARMAIAQRLQPPSADHWLGTDHFGRDILSMAMLGAQTSIAVAVVAVGIGMALGVPLGLLAWGAPVVAGALLFLGYRLWLFGLAHYSGTGS